LFNYGASIPIPIPISRQTKHSPTISLSQQLSINSKAHIDTKYIDTTYELIYQKGKVIAFGIYADDIINSNRFDNYFDRLLLKIFYRCLSYLESTYTIITNRWLYLKPNIIS